MLLLKNGLSYILHWVKSVQIRTRNNSVFGHFSRSVKSYNKVSILLVVGGTIKDSIGRGEKNQRGK